jgi:uncharacterized protein YjbI with pentapeptide repeats
MDADTIASILEKHRKWLINEPDGERINFAWADFSGADFSGTDLTGADFPGANFTGANFSGSNLSGAHLAWANFYQADLSGASLVKANLTEAHLAWADLRGSDLSWANLISANLSRASLNEADLTGALLTGANLTNANLAGVKNMPDLPLACPEEGEFIGWKKAREYIVKLLIPADAIRSSAAGRKCRCSKAKVLAITRIDGTAYPRIEVCSSRDKNFIYRIGETVEVKDFDMNRWNECSTGIHFFISRKEAEMY